MLEYDCRRDWLHACIPPLMDGARLGRSSRVPEVWSGTAIEASSPRTCRNGVSQSRLASTGNDGCKPLSECWLYAQRLCRAKGYPVPQNSKSEPLRIASCGRATKFHEQLETAQECMGLTLHSPIGVAFVIGWTDATGPRTREVCGRPYWLWVSPGD